LKDIHEYEKKTIANKDHTGRLYVGGAVGANKDYLERAKSLSDAGCDVLVLDVANGHSKLAMNATE
jgi:IMP dehydrogenase